MQFCYSDNNALSQKWSHLTEKIGDFEWLIYGKGVHVTVVVSFLVVGLFDMSVMPKSASSYTTILKLKLPQMTFVTTIRCLSCSW